METNSSASSQIPISVGIPHHNKIVPDLQFNSVNPKHHLLKHIAGAGGVKRSSSERRAGGDDTELVQFTIENRKSPLVYSANINNNIGGNNNNNNNSYVSGNAKVMSDLLTLLQTMDKENIKINIPVEVIPNLMNKSSSATQLRPQLSKSNVTDFTSPPSSVSAFAGRPGSDSTSQISKQYDALSLKSYTSVGMGSTDGRKMIVRKIPTSPVELFNLVNPPM